MGSLTTLIDTKAGPQGHGCGLTSCDSGPQAAVALLVSGAVKPEARTVKQSVAEQDAETTAQKATTTAEQQVPATAELKQQVIQRHLSDIAKARAVAMGLLGELRGTTGNPKQVVAPARQPASLRKLEAALSKLQMLERRALGQDAGGEDTLKAELKPKSRYVAGADADSVSDRGAQPKADVLCKMRRR